MAKSIPTPSGWTQVAGPDGWASEELRIAEGDTEQASPTPASVPGFPGYIQTLRRGKTNTSDWWLIVAHTTDGKSFSDMHAYVRVSETQPAFPVKIKAASGSGIWKYIAIGAGVGALVLIAGAALSRRGRR